ncbi:hypothetical protein BGP_4558 [Beggiatoa sp. PS]|nr:hypothetical protein BGP_4558 [Beggiatoa sp. PS]
MTVAKGNCSTITSADQEIFCGNDCKWRYSVGTEVILTVDQPEHYNFDGWDVHVKDDSENWVTNENSCPDDTLSCTTTLKVVHVYMLNVLKKVFLSPLLQTTNQLMELVWVVSVMEVGLPVINLNVQ